ncbi:hypothetical protein CLV47_102224 [Antricoccus suffuscus]|uniref:Uncharacterized protein n=1 Tax=Antricoccus suffuscus TaxID=1629062 RepID=A0A2T1A4K7_9ACTN|nr:hypothetical protein CLV47_102224 [Antricoccus suffuscus]
MDDHFRQRLRHPWSAAARLRLVAGILAGVLTGGFAAWAY